MKEAAREAGKAIAAIMSVSVRGQRGHNLLGSLSNPPCTGEGLGIDIIGGLRVLLRSKDDAPAGPARCESFVGCGALLECIRPGNAEAHRPCSRECCEFG